MKHFLIMLLGILTLGHEASAISPGKTAANKIFFSIAAKAGYGNLKSENGTSIPSRGFGVYGIDSDLGISLRGFKIGGALEYSFWRQAKDPAELNNTNTQGDAFSFGPMLGYDFGAFEVQGRYYLSSKYSLDRASSSGAKIAYEGPESAMAFQLRFPLGNGVPFFGLEYLSRTYKRSVVNSVETDFSDGAKIKTSAFGLLLGAAF